MVSSSEKPRSTASAASAASKAGFSLRLVTWAWLEGVRRARIFCRAIIISTVLSRLTTSTILAGVRAPNSSTSSWRGTPMSISRRATSVESRAMASSARVRSMA